MKPSAPPSWREGLRLWAPVGLAGVLVLALAWQYVEPAPPNRVVIATGGDKSLYTEFAKKYAQYFADNGVELEIRHTTGTRENYDLLLDPKSDVDLAIVQGAPRRLWRSERSSRRSVRSRWSRSLSVIARCRAQPNSPRSTTWPASAWRLARKAAGPARWLSRCWRCMGFSIRPVRRWSLKAAPPPSRI